MAKLIDVVVRDVRDRDGYKLGKVIEPHDGAEDGVITAARVVTKRRCADYSACRTSRVESARRTSVES